jgi:hypothetical protein
MARPKRIVMLGERVGAPFSAWRINADYSVSGVTLYACNDKLAHIAASQAYTARGTLVFPDTQASEYFAQQGRALEIADERATRAAREAHAAYIKASYEARNARYALAKHRGEQ